MAKITARLAKSPDASIVVGNRRSSSGTPNGAKIRVGLAEADQPPPLPPPRGYLGLSREESEEGDLEKPKRSSSSKGLSQQQQQKLYKGGARPRHSSYQINV